MKHVSSFNQFLSESQNFDTKLVDTISDLKIGEEVFKLGEWLVVKSMEGDRAVLVNPQTGKLDALTQSDLDRIQALVKVPIGGAV